MQVPKKGWNKVSGMVSVPCWQIGAISALQGRHLRNFSGGTKRVISPKLHCNVACATFSNILYLCLDSLGAVLHSFDFFLCVALVNYSSYYLLYCVIFFYQYLIYVICKVLIER